MNIKQTYEKALNELLKDNEHEMTHLCFEIPQAIDVEKLLICQVRIHWLTRILEMSKTTNKDELFRDITLKIRNRASMSSKSGLQNYRNQISMQFLWEVMEEIDLSLE